MAQILTIMMAYYKVTYNRPNFRYYEIIAESVPADSKWHAIELVYSRLNGEHSDGEYSVRAYYKAKLKK